MAATSACVQVHLFWPGATIRGPMTPVGVAGSSARLCRVYQQLNLPLVDASGSSAFQAPGGNFGGTCRGFCAAFGLACLMQWGDLSNTCAVEQGKKTDCDFRDGDTSDHVCTCVPADAVDPAAGAGLVLHGGATAGLAGCSVSGSGDANLVLWNSTVAAARSAFQRASKEGMRLAAGSAADLDGVDVGRNGQAGLSLGSGSAASARGGAVRSNRGQGALVDEGSKLVAAGTNFSGNAQEGIKVTRTSRADMEGGSVDGNAAAGLLVQVGSTVTAVNVNIAQNAGSGLVVESGSAADLERCSVVANNASQLAPSQGGGAIVIGNSTLTASLTAFSENSAEQEGGGVFFDGSSGGNLRLQGCSLAGNSARAFGGGLRVVNTVPLVHTAYAIAAGQPESYLVPTNNGTHLFLLTNDYCLRALPLLGARPLLSDLPVIVGTPEQSGLRDGRQDDPDPSRRPQLQSFQMRGAISPGGGLLFMTAVLTNVQALFSPIRIVDLRRRAVSTLAAFDAELNQTLGSQGRSVSCIQPDRTGRLLYICHRAAIRAVDLASGRIATVAGQVDSPGWSDGVGRMARFAGPEQVALFAGDGDNLETGQLFMIDYLASGPTFAVRALDLATRQVRTLVSDQGKRPSSTLIDGPAATATLGDIWSIAVAPDGMWVFLMSYTYSCVRAVSTVTGYTRTYVALCSLTSTGDQIGGALDARLSIPDMLTAAGDTLFLYDQGNRKIKAAAAPDPIQISATVFKGNKAAYGAGASLMQVCDAN